jgi:hypothetical protein
MNVILINDNIIFLAVIIHSWNNIYFNVHNFSILNLEDLGMDSIVAWYIILSTVFLGYVFEVKYVKDVRKFMCNRTGYYMFKLHIC